MENVKDDSQSHKGWNVKNPWGNEQNSIETHWDSFVSIYYFTCFATFEAQKKKGVTVGTINNVM